VRALCDVRCQEELQESNWIDHTGGMRHAVLALVIVLALVRESRGEGDIEAWVGTWSGKVRSKGCVDRVSKKIALEITVTAEGGLRSSGDVIVEGWGALDWELDGDDLTFARDGMTGSLRSSKAAANLTLRTDGGCRVTARLRRSRSGIASCHHARALAAAKSRCAALPVDTRGRTLADIEAAWAGWDELEGAERAAQAKACADQAWALEVELAACDPTGVPECDAALETLLRYPDCPRAERHREKTRKAVRRMRAEWKQAGTTAAGQCRDFREQLVEETARRGCTLQ
jgi:hypothetical protein